MNDCIFCKIVKGEIPADKIYEDDNILVFLDLFPQCPGQALVIPKKHCDYFIKMNDQEYLELQRTAKNIASVLERTFQPLRVCLVIEGFDVPHVHVKLFPADNMQDLRAKGAKASPCLLSSCTLSVT